MNSYLNLGFNVLKNNTVSVYGTNLDCIFDNSTYRDKKAFGFEAEDDCIITVRTEDLPKDARHMLKTLVEINGESWEIIATKRGSATTQFTLSSPHKL